MALSNQKDDDWKQVPFFDAYALFAECRAKNEKCMLDYLQSGNRLWAWPAGECAFIIHNGKFMGSSGSVGKAKRLLDMSPKFIDDHFEVETDAASAKKIDQAYMVVQNMRKSHPSWQTNSDNAARQKILRAKEEGIELFHQKNYAKAQQSFEDAYNRAHQLAIGGGQRDEDKIIRSQICFNLSVCSKLEKKWELCFRFATDAYKLNPQYAKAQKMLDFAVEQMKIINRMANDEQSK